MVMNLMTQDGETEGYTAADHLRELLRHGAPGMVDGCLANSSPIPEHLQEEYLREGADVMKIDRERVEAQGVKLYTAPLLSSRCEYARHDPILLTQAIMEVFNQQARRRKRRSGYR